MISGAGPTLLALCNAEVAQAVEASMVQAWQGEGVEARGAVLDLQTEGSRWQKAPPRADA